MQLVDLFGSTRDEWIDHDLDGWLAANEIYEGMPQVLEHLLQRHALYIVTTKQARVALTMHWQHRVLLTPRRYISTYT